MGKDCILSIIVPVYNAEKYIKQCLDSLLNQDVIKEEYEIVCINDGSRDNSLQVLQEYEKDNKNMVVIDKENGGVSKARNCGLDIAKGDYVWFVDADDWIARDCLGTIFNAIKTCDPSVLQMQFDYIKAEWRIKEKQAVCLLKDRVEIKDGHGCPMRYDGAWSSIIKKEVLTRFEHRFLEELAYGEDILFVRELFDLLEIKKEEGIFQKVIYLENDIFYYYRMNDDSAMRSAWTKNRDKYAEGLLKLARINKRKAEDINKPDWYRKKYEEHFYRRMYNYLMDWLPGLSVNVKKKLKELKKEGLYPCKKMPKELRKKFFGAQGFAGRIKSFYKHSAFKYAWVYKIYYCQMSKKYQGESNN
ncbi:MAG: glycosyltransferase family 2 protein [Clostridia bacterium]|nr:glycosyltransferase family 2 protein [Clostridia bacterium]